MVWKPREKKLTPEEAIALAKEELKSFWFNSSPLVAAIKSESRVTAHPLDKSFTENPWLVLFLDPASFSGRSVLRIAKEWHKRYCEYGIGILGVLKSSLPGLFTRLTIEEFHIRQKQIQFPMVLDSDGLLQQAFGAEDLPKLVLISNGSIILNQSGSEWGAGSEERVQRFLRETDPGLPLEPALDLPALIEKDAGAIDLGKGKLPAETVTLTGRWQQDSDHLVTSDPSATLRFRAPSGKVSLLTRSASTTTEPARVTVEVNGMPVFEENFGKDLQLEDDGRCTIGVKSGPVYDVLKSLEANRREVTLQFPYSDRIPACLFGIRFSD